MFKATTETMQSNMTPAMQTMPTEEPQQDLLTMNVVPTSPSSIAFDQPLDLMISSAEQTTVPLKDTSSLKPARRPRRKLQKNPNAPRRFKSAYILYAAEKQREVRSMLEKRGVHKPKSTAVSKYVSRAWKALNGTEKAMWQERARQDRKRYETEKATYSGPWKVPISKTRAPKDPNAPKRPLTAFFMFSNSHRKEVASQFPKATNAEISRTLSQMWKAASATTREPFLQKEQRLKDQYKAAKAAWLAEKSKHENSEPDGNSSATKGSTVSTVAATKMTATVPTTATATATATTTTTTTTTTTIVKDEQTMKRTAVAWNALRDEILADSSDSCPAARSIGHVRYGHSFFSGFTPDDASVGEGTDGFDPCNNDDAITVKGNFTDIDSLQIDGSGSSRDSDGDSVMLPLSSTTQFVEDFCLGLDDVVEKMNEMNQPGQSDEISVSDSNDHLVSSTDREQIMINCIMEMDLEQSYW